MKVYLMRHGDAGESLDPFRHLTPKGKKEVERQGKWLKRNANVLDIYYSPKFRCFQTALILGRILDVYVSPMTSLDEGKIPVFMHGEDDCLFVTHHDVLNTLGLSSEATAEVFRVKVRKDGSVKEKWRHKP